MKEGLAPAHSLAKTSTKPRWRPRRLQKSESATTTRPRSRSRCLTSQNRSWALSLVSNQNARSWSCTVKRLSPPQPIFLLSIYQSPPRSTVIRRKRRLWTRTPNLQSCPHWLPVRPMLSTFSLPQKVGGHPLDLGASTSDPAVFSSHPTVRACVQVFCCGA